MITFECFLSHFSIFVLETMHDTLLSNTDDGITVKTLTSSQEAKLLNGKQSGEGSEMSTDNELTDAPIGLSSQSIDEQIGEDDLVTKITKSVDEPKSKAGNVSTDKKLPSTKPKQLKKNFGNKKNEVIMNLVSPSSIISTENEKKHNRTRTTWGGKSRD